VQPSSRTPEGSPVHCPLCGAESRIEISNPPGDAVCPSCGCHLWALDVPAQRNAHASLVEEAKSQIRANVSAFNEIVTSSSSLPVVGKALVECLTNSLAAYGATFWIKKRKRWWQRRDKMKIVSCIGEIDSLEFIKSVVASGEPCMCEQVREAETVLLIGVPLIKGHELCGAIEVVQRANSPNATRRGYLRFVSQMVSLVAESRALRT
jgi:hypothetical protein